MASQKEHFQDPLKTGQATVARKGQACYNPPDVLELHPSAVLTKADERHSLNICRTQASHPVLCFVLFFW